MARERNPKRYCHVIVSGDRPRQGPVRYRLCANNAVAPADQLASEASKTLPICPDCHRLLLTLTGAARADALRATRINERHAEREQTRCVGALIAASDTSMRRRGWRDR